MERHDQSTGFSSQRQGKTVPNVEQRSVHSLKMPLATLSFRYARKTSGVEL